MAAKLSAEAASEYLGVSRGTFYRRVRPTIPAIRIGSRTLFDPADLDAWAESHKESARRPSAALTYAPEPVRSVGVHKATHGVCYVDENGRLQLREPERDRR